jgi:hypothetical protein
MMKSIEGIYQNGKVKLLEPGPANGKSRVIVTFVPFSGPEGQKKRLTKTHAANLRTRLKTFQEDWDRPEMDVYDAL